MCTKCYNAHLEIVPNLDRSSQDLALEQCKPEEVESGVD